MQFLRTKKAGSIHDKSLISFTITGFANSIISADSYAVKICSVGNFRNSFHFISKHMRDLQNPLKQAELVAGTAKKRK